MQGFGRAAPKKTHQKLQRSHKTWIIFSSKTMGCLYRQHRQPRKCKQLFRYSCTSRSLVRLSAMAAKMVA